MKPKLSWVLLLTFLAVNLGFASPAKRHYSTHDYYIIEHDPQLSSLDDVANSLGVEVVEQTGELVHHWLVRVEKPSQRLSSREPIDPVIEKFERLRRQAESISDLHLSSRSTDALRARSIVSSVKHLSRQSLRHRVKRAPVALSPLDDPPPSSAAIALRLGIKDPLFPDQWHLINEEYPEHMVNVTGVWEMGITGKGVISAVIDDGLDYTSDDLAANFVSSIILLFGLLANANLSLVC
jgi:kexin